ncbi:hypothetical protein I7I50_08957 [Histoplasma capsulatum G186AR]|uniref:Uncharacterized protein n=1 Tax=Ajellomyces capsulatus TaxID=5037 RepID=A0A8H7YTT5_AJECA|nr:hypothetical protein I7I52_06473 [Histoplasma capsulatum]QSS73990.1 hypothetical protein I7I50_08957 [Histoplasma capsulatum G186AR]
MIHTAHSFHGEVEQTHMGTLYAPTRQRLRSTGLSPVCMYVCMYVLRTSRCSSVCFGSVLLSQRACQHNPIPMRITA